MTATLAQRPATAPYPAHADGASTSRVEHEVSDGDMLLRERVRHLEAELSQALASQKVCVCVVVGGGACHEALRGTWRPSSARH